MNPTIMALKILTNTPPSIARRTNLERVLLFSGQSTAIPDTQIPRLPTLANPQREMDVTSAVLASNVLNMEPNSWNATNSLMISLFPNKEPSNKICCVSNPIKKPNGAKI